MFTKRETRKPSDWTLSWRAVASFLSSYSRFVIGVLEKPLRPSQRFRQRNCFERLVNDLSVVTAGKPDLVKYQSGNCDGLVNTKHVPSARQGPSV